MIGKALKKRGKNWWLVNFVTIEALYVLDLLHGNVG